MYLQLVVTMSNINEDDEMLPGYDFAGGVRGKHYQAYRRGHSVTIHKQDGTTETQHFTLTDVNRFPIIQCNDP
jgi:hypothetical protein